MEEEKRYLTVGELAKKMNVSVRTIQYYDQIGLLSPTRFTEGGRRLYAMEDYIILYQIISLKEFGFSLKQIKERLMPADKIEEIDRYLISQEKTIENEIIVLKKKHELINKFRNEMIRINKIDWEMFIEVLSLLRNNDENYWIVKYFDKNVFERLKDCYKNEKGEIFFGKMSELCDRALVLQSKGIPIDSEETLKLSEAWWLEVMNFTDGDTEMIEQMVKMSKDQRTNNSGFMKKFKSAEGYINEALTVYFRKNSKDNTNQIGDGDND